MLSKIFINLYSKKKSKFLVNFGHISHVVLLSTHIDMVVKEDPMDIATSPLPASTDYDKIIRLDNVKNDYFEVIVYLLTLFHSLLLISQFPSQTTRSHLACTSKKLNK